MEHTESVKRYDSSPEQLAEDLGNLYYDALAEFLALFATKMARDAAADLGRGRPKLAAELEACAGHLDAAAQHIQTAWAICAPHVAIEPDSPPVAE
jgi:hypothetical protein